MKKYFFVLMCVLFLNYDIVDAYTCKFEGDVNENKSWWNSLVGAEGYFEIEISSDKIESIDGQVNQVIDPYIDSSWTFERIVKELDGKCPSSVVVCTMKNLDFSTAGTFLIMNDTLEAKLIEQDIITIPRKTTFGGTLSVRYKYDDCVWFDYNEDGSSESSSNIIYECEQYADFYKELQESYNTNYTAYTNSLNKIKSFCDLVFQNLDAKNSCSKECLKLPKDISIIEGNSSNTSITNNCGFSERLFTWILNIFKWIKYILPVIVIVFGILDFIKAIGADKEDEMKKAQKRFIIRLIAAALVFIIPLILEFILIKMGFTYEGCGIFD